MVDARNLLPRLPPLKLFIGGKWVDPCEGTTLPVNNPATGEKICDAPAATARDVDLAVRAARKAFDTGEWPRMNASKRASILRRFAELLWERREEVALLESMNNGKTFKMAIAGDVGPGSATLSYFSEWANKVTGEVLPVDGPFHTYVLKEPVGVVGAIVPWNYPTSLACWKLGPALAVGCTVVLKPSELTPLSALKLAELSIEAGFPEGVLNVVPGFGDPAGQALATHMLVDKVSFTGSTRTARRLVHASADSNLKKLTLELGGKSPQIILPDADVQAAVDACFWGIFGNKGEVCNAGSRVLVHSRMYDEFTAALVEKAKKMIVGDPLHPKTQMGAQVSNQQLNTILSYVSAGKEEGAKLLTGGERDIGGTKSKGHFMQPTIFGEVKPNMKIAQEEIFGPVLSCIRVEDDAQAVEVANGTMYGLAAAIWTKDVAKAHAMAKRIKAGVVWINCFNEFDDAAPFGGYKQSGWGRDLSAHALDGYLNVKAVWTKLPEV